MQEENKLETILHGIELNNGVFEESPILIKLIDAYSTKESSFLLELSNISGIYKRYENLNS